MGLEIQMPYMFNIYLHIDAAKVNNIRWQTQMKRIKLNEARSAKTGSGAVKSAASPKQKHG